MPGQDFLKYYFSLAGRPAGGGNGSLCYRLPYSFPPLPSPVWRAWGRYGVKSQFPPLEFPPHPLHQDNFGTGAPALPSVVVSFHLRVLGDC